MPLYRAPVAQLRAQLLDGSLVPHLVEQYVHRLSHRPSDGEVRSWERRSRTT